MLRWGSFTKHGRQSATPHGFSVYNPSFSGADEAKPSEVSTLLMSQRVGRGEGGSTLRWKRQQQPTAADVALTLSAHGVMFAILLPKTGKSILPTIRCDQQHFESYFPLMSAKPVFICFLHHVSFNLFEQFWHRRGCAGRSRSAPAGSANRWRRARARRPQPTTLLFYDKVDQRRRLVAEYGGRSQPTPKIKTTNKKSTGYEE